MRRIQAHEIAPNCWILQEWGTRMGLLTKQDTVYNLYVSDLPITHVSLDQVHAHLNCVLEFPQADETQDTDTVCQDVEGLPIKHDQAHNVLIDPRVSYTRTIKGATRHAAGYWCIRFDTNWMGSLSPKCVTLDAHDHKGPFSSKLEMNTILNKLRKE
jgi:hypothetical protein